ncbi:MAG: 30S ribosomal protein S8 [Deltaproteobacteria bacterium]|nr:MAG: 30S ribosomal protein S8 [Deltaproteobacteria bacterium]
MCMTDPIADMLTRIRNAAQAGHERVQIPASNMKRRIAAILQEEGYIRSFRMIPAPPQGIIEIELKYEQTKEPTIRGIVRVSKPGRRIYVKRKEIPPVLNGMGVAILSTSKGILTDAQARSMNVGGELLCKVW